jgi:DNA-binding transcriptional LysR family regulator
MNAAASQGKHLNVRIQVRSFGAVLRMVGAGVGIGLVPRSALMFADPARPPRVLELSEAWAQRDLQICVRRREQLSGFAAALVETLAQSCNTGSNADTGQNPQERPLSYLPSPSPGKA